MNRNEKMIKSRWRRVREVAAATALLAVVAAVFSAALVRGASDSAFWDAYCADHAGDALCPPPARTDG